MKTNTLYNALTFVVLTMAIIQTPLFYYSSVFTIFLFLPYMFVGLGLTIWLLKAVLNDTKSKRNKFQKIGVVSALVVGSFSLFLGRRTIEKLDWELRRNSREHIVELVKLGKLKPNGAYNNGICALDGWNIPPISNGGNEIWIDKTNDNKFSVGFYIFRGLLDNYTAFVYTDDPAKMAKLDLNADKKLDKHWYRVSE